MAFSDVMNKVRYWDNRSAKWMMRHFYILFFEFVLVAIFLVFFANVLHVINLGADVEKNNNIEQLLLIQSVNGLIIVILLLLNSFWMLYMFSSIIRFRSILKEISFNTSKWRKPAQS